MRPAFRIVPAALAAFVVALALVTPSVAHRTPPHPPNRADTVSSHVPYIAPWQSGFERFSTQIFTPGGAGTNHLSMLIPGGQWWRIVYLSATLFTNAVVASRQVQVDVTAPDGSVSFLTATPLTQAATTVGAYLFGPGLTSFANTVPAQRQFGCAALPDVLWPQGDTISLQSTLGSGGDQLFTPAFAVEIYTENDRGSLVPQKLTPAPLIP